MAHTPSSNPTEKEWTPESIRIALRKLRRRLTEVEAFDPSTVTRQYDPKATGLETSLRETLAEVFGGNSASYRNYQLAASLHTAARRLNATPLPVVIEGLGQGKERSITLLKGAIQSLEEKMQDDFPEETLDQVALSARTAIISTGSVGIQGASVQGIAGDVSVSIQHDAHADVARFEELTSRVALLEASLNQLRREVNVAMPDREIGPGHNHGPDLAPVPIEELDDVDNLIALLKEQGPVPPADPIELTKLSQKASQVSDKIKQYLDHPVDCAVGTGDHGYKSGCARRDCEWDAINAIEIGGPCSERLSGIFDLHLCGRYRLLGNRISHCTGEYRIRSRWHRAQEPTS